MEKSPVNSAPGESLQRLRRGFIEDTPQRRVTRVPERRKGMWEESSWWLCGGGARRPSVQKSCEVRGRRECARDQRLCVLGYGIRAFPVGHCSKLRVFKGDTAGFRFPKCCWI